MKSILAEGRPGIELETNLREVLSCIIIEKAFPTRAFSWLTATKTIAFTFKMLLRHYEDTILSVHQPTIIRCENYIFDVKLGA